MERLLNNIIQGIFEFLQVTFEKCLKLNKVAETPFLKAVNIFCWGTISQMMYELKDRLPYHNNGMILCGCIIAKTSNISDMDLELGTECIKHMSDIIIDKNNNLSKEEKEFKKEWIKEKFAGYSDAGLRCGDYFYWCIGNSGKNVCGR